MSEQFCQTIQDYFAELEDPRSSRNQRHKLEDILVIALCAMLSNADDFVAMEEYGQAKESWFRQYLELPHGIPSHDTFRQLFKNLNSESLHNCFTRWAHYLVAQTEQIAIDGKRQCGAHAQGEYPPCSVNAYSCEQGVVLSQRTTEDKRSEVKALREILDVLDVRGCLVSLDAGGCYQEVAEQIVAAGGDYLLAVKGNQPTLYDELDELFANRLDELETSSEGEASHGRHDERHTWVSHDLESLPEASSWPRCATVAMVQRICRDGQKETAEHRYYISSRVLDAAESGDRVRSHWQVENNLHWVLDMAFDEDRSRARTGNCSANLVVLRQWAFNLLKQDTSKRLGIKNKRKRAGWDMSYLVSLLKLAEVT